MLKGILLVLSSLSIINAAIIQRYDDFNLYYTDNTSEEKFEVAGSNVEPFEEISAVVDTLTYLSRNLPDEHREFKQHTLNHLDALKSVVSTDAPPIPLEVRLADMTIPSPFQIFKRILHFVHNVLDDNEHTFTDKTVVKRATRFNVHGHEDEEDEEEPSEEEISDAATVLDKIHKKSLGKMDRLRGITEGVQSSAEILHKASQSKMVKSLFKYVCKKVGHKVEFNEDYKQISEGTKGEEEEGKSAKDEKSAKENATEDKSMEKKGKKTFAEKMCSRKTYRKMQTILENGKKAVSVLSKVLKKENVDKIRTFLSMFKKNP